MCDRLLMLVVALLRVIRRGLLAAEKRIMVWEWSVFIQAQRRLHE